MPDRSDYDARRISETLERWDACVLCGLRHVAPALLALKELGEPYDTVCNDCAVHVLNLSERLVRVPIPRS